MTADLERLVARLERESRRAWWKAVMAFVAAAVLFTGGVLIVATMWHPGPRVINVHVEGKL